MRVSTRHTVVVFGKLKAREQRLAAARQRRHGLQILTIEQLACRLAGGFSRPIEDELLRASIQASLSGTELGELDAIKSLPGMVDACVDTLRKVWTSEVDLASGAHARLESVRRLEAAVAAALPSGMSRPGELVKQAIQRVSHAPAVFGTVDVLGMTELEPCWRTLLFALSKATTVRWVAGPRSVPDWLQSTDIEVVTAEKCSPQVTVISASTASHEAIEALRWARQLVASGMAKPEDVAIASVSPSQFDDHFLALRADANLELHFAHGTKVTASRDGQAAAALADILRRGVSQRRLRRLVSLLSGSGPIAELPKNWMQFLPREAPLSSASSWEKFLGSLRAEDWPDAADHTPELRAIIDLLLKGYAEAAEIGDALLRGRAQRIWRKALAAGPAASLDLTLQSMREDDGLEACTSVAWMPASYLAASPRRFVRLLGLNSSRWPRRISEDRLLSDHIVSRKKLDPLPVSEADRRDFQTILDTTERQVVLTYSRRDSDGRLLGRSGLLQGKPDSAYLRRHRVPEHAYSETDRMAAQPTEFRATPQAASADACWRDWLNSNLTPHDGVLQPNHPVVLAALNRLQSASSLSLLLRNPLGFIWRYGLGMKAPELLTEPLVLEPKALGNLVHSVLDVALQNTVSDAAAGRPADIPGAVRAAMARVSAEWEALQPTPPRALWQRTLAEVEQLSLYAMSTTSKASVEWNSFSEVAFGGAKLKSPAALPWDALQSVQVPGTQFNINGYIDRLDVATAGGAAAVFDYKTGKAPKAPIVLDGGKELQRCLYAFAVKQLLGASTTISAALLYLREEQELRLDNPEAVLTDLQQYLAWARDNLASGSALPGTAAADKYDNLAFALPANAKGTYCERKMPAVLTLLGQAADVWGAK